MTEPRDPRVTPLVNLLSSTTRSYRTVTNVDKAKAILDLLDSTDLTRQELTVEEADLTIQRLSVDNRRLTGENRALVQELAQYKRFVRLTNGNAL